MKWLNKKSYPEYLLVMYLLLFIWSAISPKDYNVWLLEIIGVFFLIVVYIYFYKKIRFSNTTNTWFFIAASLITVGAHYSFPNVPLFENLKGMFGFERNDFDKLGHVVQGILPVLIAWEVLIKNHVVRNFYWINFLSLNIALSVSAFYELFEWLFIVVLGDNSYTYDVLGTQGYVWDAQSDMLCALLGAILTIFIGSKHLHKMINQSHSTHQKSTEKILIKKCHTSVATN
ncbi:DUF2238 domain-containing protein [Sunxiuqinia indica]|uniref:DUF2238 domain-containing protein n=1 Tax=Sunxiuqinia indica TaxID=2692584 RepID=UPI001357D78C|nr:DUF2238 domain-containing protein [Sunxiuqinia indica]